MNTSNIKSYAPKARKNFIAAISKQAAKYGITEHAIESIKQTGDLALIGERPFPASIIKPRAALVHKIEQCGFTQVIEHVAYSWFNRLCAIRYMELKDYLEHRRRVLSHPSQPGSFQILDDCLDIELPGLDQAKIRELKLDGTQDELLYRELLLAQCHALHKAMPFLFEAVADETELLLPENLTKTDSLIHELVNTIPEEDWQSVEIIGWLYQFYISEKKDEVIGKVVQSEDIPAATQLFTPNWIVKYMVQNSLGAQWQATYPESPLKAHMEYYIEPAEQSDEVNAQLKAITPSALNPEELTLIDPACGSGHILVEAYDVFKAIYLERGYRQRDIAPLILEKNLFGLDIDQRAAQLTGFALMMKGREDDRGLFGRNIQLNVMAMVDSIGFEVDALMGVVDLAHYGLEEKDLFEFKKLFEHATTFGSLIQVPDGLREKLPAIKRLSELNSQDIFASGSIKNLAPFVKQAEILAFQYDAVVANPPYMGSGNMNYLVKKFAKEKYPDAKSDLFSCFIERGFTLTKDAGYNSMVTMESWMFLSGYEEFREKILKNYTLRNLAHFPYDGKRPTAMGINFGVAVVSLKNMRVPSYQGHYCCSRYYELNDNGIPFEFPTLNERLKVTASDEFEKIPGTPLAYWISTALSEIFNYSAYGDCASVRQGMATTDNERFLRQWHEISLGSIGFKYRSPLEGNEAGYNWFPYNKGGEYRKWYGNLHYVVNYKRNGEDLIDLVKQKYPKISDAEFVIKNRSYYCKEAITWSDVTSGKTSFRYLPAGFIFDGRGSCIFPLNQDFFGHIEYLNTPIVVRVAELLNPTMVLNPGEIKKIPFFENSGNNHGYGSLLVDICKQDWNTYERSWDFDYQPLVKISNLHSKILKESYKNWVIENSKLIEKMKYLEEENNIFYISKYNLMEEISPNIPIEQITLTINPAYRYGIKNAEEERNIRFREDTMKELVSYAIGCIMGRYSLDKPGLIYAHSGNEGFDPTRYQKFPADDDGIIPLTDKEWFADDATLRLVEFISVTWDAKHLEENLAFLADNLSPKKGESSRETIRSYLCDSFYKDHTQTYKKRPIYWLFTSGKQKAFQCLVYLHRYNEGTLARMRTEYVIPLTAKLSTYVTKLEQDKEASNSTTDIKKLEKEIATLHKQQAELSTFDEKLRHYADQRISLDLDDGVKVNYGKFGDLLADVKAITGDKAE